MTVLFTGVGLLLIELKWIKASYLQVFIVYCILFSVFSIIAILYNLTSKYFVGNEGFYFLGTLILKMISVAVLLLSLIKFRSLENHSLLFLSLISYFIFSIIDINYKIQIIKQ